MRTLNGMKQRPVVVSEQKVLRFCVWCDKPMIVDPRGYGRKRVTCSQECSRKVGWANRYGGVGPVRRVLEIKECELCGRDEDLVVDHCHTDKRVRGRLCGTCNRAIGMLGDDTVGIRRTLEYLERTN